MDEPLQEHPSCVLLHQTLARLSAPIIISIAGDSGSGKTTFSQGIRQLLGETFVKTIETDGYHKENREQRKISGRLPLDPDANHLDLLLTHIKNLKEGKTIDIPRYNHNTGDFDAPYRFSPSPIIIIEGLHALYPQYLPYMDFTIFVDPCRKVKRQWKYERDMKKRGHEAEKLEEEMVRREAAYKRWIDFQKTSATVVIKIFHSKLADFTSYDFSGSLPSYCYKVELIMEPAAKPLASVLLPFDLASILNPSHFPFLLSSIPVSYWGRQMMDIHVDGVLSEKTIAALEKEIISCTGIQIKEIVEMKNSVTATEFTQLIIVWRFLEQVMSKFEETQGA